MANQTSYKTELIKMRKKVFDTLYAGFAIGISVSMIVLVCAFCDS